MTLMLYGRHFVIHIYNMRQGDLTYSEIEAAERAKDDRIRGRKNGYSMMELRDMGRRQLSNGWVIQWPVEERFAWGPETNGVKVRTNKVPEGKFELSKDGKAYLFDAEEFRKWLRWC